LPGGCARIPSNRKETYEMNQNLPFSKLLSFPCVALLLAVCAMSYRAIGQSAQAQPKGLLQPKPVSLAHLYWHFLIYQNFLDTKAAELAAQGKSGDSMRNDLQSRLGFSDGDYAPIRSSSERLALEISSLGKEARALQAPGSSLDPGQIRSLAALRETYISNEVYNLAQELSPQNKAQLETFMKQFFAPKQISTKSFAQAKRGEAQQ
jgi:hypothetical protein